MSVFRIAHGKSICIDFDDLFYIDFDIQLIFCYILSERLVRLLVNKLELN